MKWIQQYHVRNYIKSSGWIFPLLCMIVALITLPVTREFDAWAGRALLGSGKEWAKAISAGILATQLSFLAFIFWHSLLQFKLRALSFRLGSLQPILGTYLAIISIKTQI